MVSKIIPIVFNSNKPEKANGRQTTVEAGKAYQDSYNLTMVKLQNILEDV